MQHCCTGIYGVNNQMEKSDKLKLIQNASIAIILPVVVLVNANKI